MKLITATATTQGQRDNDYCWTVEGELVYIGFTCATDMNNPDGGCGCGRGWAGLNSHRATTTAMVRDLDLTRDDYAEALRSGLEQQGWSTDDVQDLADRLAHLADSYPVGAVLERRLDDVACR